MANVHNEHHEHGAQTGRKGPRQNPIDRRMAKFLREPPSIRIAASVIVTATAMLVAVAGVVIRLVDHREYDNVWVGMWWALQTVTTVGYGDVTPKEPAGRIVGVFVMLEGLALLAILTAAITSTFVARAARENLAAAASDESEFHAMVEARLEDLAGRFDDLTGRFARIESMIAASSGRNDAPGS